jgi:hypothetical protein
MGYGETPRLRFDSDFNVIHSNDLTVRHGYFLPIRSDDPARRPVLAHSPGCQTLSDCKQKAPVGPAGPELMCEVRDAFGDNLTRILRLNAHRASTPRSIAIWPNPRLCPPMCLLAGRWPAAFMGCLVGILTFVVAWSFSCPPEC